MKKTANGNGGGKWITRVRRLALYLRDGLCCAYCRRDLHDAPARDITLDHLTCRAKGGKNHRNQNLVTACRSCNSRRQDTPLHLFCDPETRAAIRRRTRRSLARYIALAKALLEEPACEA
jgi:hypothetical protein